MNRHQKAFYLAFIACLFIVWSPFNALAYLSPAIVLVFFLVVTGSRVAGRNLVVWILMWVVAILGHALFVPQFAYHSAVISIVTYSSFAVLFCVSSRNLANPRLLGRLVLWIRWVVLIQAVLGISQAAYGFAQTGSFDLANGDFVEGTIHPWLESEGSFSNPMFATNMVMMLIALAPSAVLKKRGLLPFTLGMIALILASVIHVLLMVALSATVAFLV